MMMVDKKQDNRGANQHASGISEVASIGGFVKEYQIDVDPDALHDPGRAGKPELTAGKIPLACNACITYNKRIYFNLFSTTSIYGAC